MHLVLGDLVVTAVDEALDGAGGHAVDGAADRLAGAEDLLAGAGEGGSHGAGTHDAGDADEVVLGDVAVVLDVLLLLSVTQRLLERLDDVGRGSRDDLDGSLTVLADQLDSDVQALPGLSGLDDIIGDLLGGLYKAKKEGK